MLQDAYPLISLFTRPALNFRNLPRIKGQLIFTLDLRNDLVNDSLNSSILLQCMILLKALQFDTFIHKWIWIVKCPLSLRPSYSIAGNGHCWCTNCRVILLISWRIQRQALQDCIWSTFLCISLIALCRELCKYRPLSHNGESVFIFAIPKRPSPFHRRDISWNAGPFSGGTFGVYLRMGTQLLYHFWPLIVCIAGIMHP